MRVLVVHNRYSSRVPSGENLAVDDEVRWLREAGVEVHVHEVTNDELVTPGAMAQARSGIEGMWSAIARRRFLTALADTRAEVVHVHNLFPLLTGSVPAAASKRGVPVLWTVHNRRVRCVGGGWFREGQPCHDCRPGWRLPGVVHGCYAGSRAGSAVVTVGTTLFRTSARRNGGLTAVAISNAVAAWLTRSAGIPRDRVVVKPNGVAGPPSPPPPASEQRTFVFLGRLSAYKGVTLMLDAWRRADVDAELHIVGDGDLGNTVGRAAADDRRIRWFGHVGPADVGDHIAAARTVLVPSTWVEPFGRTAAEAMAYGRPVITTGTGGLAEIVDAGSGWTTGVSAEAMAKAIRTAAGDDASVRRMGVHARERHAAHFSPAATTAALIEIYDRAAAHSAAGHR